MFIRVRSRKYLNLLTFLVVLLPILAACGQTSGGTAGGTGAEGAATSAAAGAEGAAATSAADEAAGAATSAADEAGGAATSAPAGGAAPAATGAAGAAGGGAIEPLAEPVTIEVMATVRSTELAAPGADWIVAKAVKEQLNIDLKMTWVTQASEYDRLVLTRGAANDLPDVFQSSTNLARDLGGQGLLADWTPFLKFMPNYVKERDVEKLAPVGTFEDKLYALTQKSPDPYKQSVAIRQDWLEKLKLQTPKTLDEYMAVMKAFTEQDPDGNGAKDTYGWSGAVNTLGQLQQFEPIFGAFGAVADANAPWRIDGGKLVYVPTTPERRDALQFIAQMNEAGVIDPDWKTQKPEDWRNKWKAGKIGIFQEDWCAGFCAGNHDPFAKANPTGRLVDIAPPVGQGGKSAISTWSRVGNRYSMSQRAVDDGKGEAIAKFMEWLNGPGYLLTSFGEEGTMWKREGGKIVPDQKNEFRIVRALSGWSLKGSEEELRARYDQTNKFPNNTTIAVWDIVQRAQQHPKVDVTDLQVLPPPPAAQAADLSRIRAEAELQFATGQRPLSEWDAYVQSLQSAGLTDWQAQAEARGKEAGLLK
jgi:putative aldouronate transport system substrate-binding protein